MEKKYYKLVVEVEVEGLIKKEMKYTYMPPSLVDIDKLTLPYESEEDFFYKNKERIKSSIKPEYTFITGLPLTDIFLKRVYITDVTDESHEMRALFRTIKYQETPISLQGIILKKMWKGRLYSFYNCDKKRAASEEYDSFFKEINPSILERIELNCCKYADVTSVWDKISSSQRIVPLLRFLLIEEDNFEKLFILFCERIPSKEDTNNTVNNTINKNNEVIKSVIRCPYVEK